MELGAAPSRLARDRRTADAWRARDGGGAGPGAGWGGRASARQFPLLPPSWRSSTCAQGLTVLGQAPNWQGELERQSRLFSRPASSQLAQHAGHPGWFRAPWCRTLATSTCCDPRGSLGVHTAGQAAEIPAGAVRQERCRWRHGAQAQGVQGAQRGAGWRGSSSGTWVSSRQRRGRGGGGGRRPRQAPARGARERRGEGGSRGGHPEGCDVLSPHASSRQGGPTAS